MNGYYVKKGYSFSIGHTFQTESGKIYKIISFLGRGGQGEVYRVQGADGEYAVKWYHSRGYLDKIDAEAFRINLRRNAENGLPTLSSGDVATQFIWPLQMINSQNNSFGYLMKIFPTGYEPMKNVIMLRRRHPESNSVEALHWKSWFVCITAALNIVRAFEILHASGFSYQDLNDGGISINMENGNVLICDCDNVSPDKTNLGIRGMKTYMAPEVVLGEKLPDRLTDQFSLAVVLFRLFLHGHPMHGIESRMLNNSEHVSQQEAEMRIYGSQPHYCLSRRYNINPPDKNTNWDVCQLSFNYPLVLMDAFEQVFTEGVCNPTKRLTATEWRKVLLEVRDSLVLVNGAESFFRLRQPKPLPVECRTLVYPHGREVLCMPGKILYKYHLDEYGTDFKTPVAKIIPTNKSGILGLYNATGMPIHFSDGNRSGVCEDQERMPLLKGMTLNVNGLALRVE